MVPVSDALKMVHGETLPLGTERIHVSECVGRVLAEDIVSDSDVPPFDRSQMDGFAIVASDTVHTPVQLKIVGESAAGGGWHHTVNPGEAVRIMTGAPVPAGADAVQRVELTSEGAGGITYGPASGGTVTIFEPVKQGKSIVTRGAEVKKGEVVLRAGQIITRNNIAVPAAFGYTNVLVSKKPHVAILSTGSEVVDIDVEPGRDQIRNSNSVMLSAMVEYAGASAHSFGTTGDDIAAIKTRLTEAADGNEILVITGGVSVGKYDLTKQALRELGAKILFEKVCLKPGKPTVFAKLGETLIFGLPGNPVSAAVAFHLFVRTALMIMEGASKAVSRSGHATSASDIKAAKDRDTYLPSQLETDQHGRLVARTLRSQGSSDFIGYAHADALVFLAAGESCKEGGVVEILYL